MNGLAPGSNGPRQAEAPAAPTEKATDKRTRAGGRRRAAAADQVATLQGELEQLRAELEQQQLKVEENLLGWQRAQADFANYRRRSEQERSDREKLAQAGLILQLLSILDDLERAWQTLPSELRQLTWIGGIGLVDHKLRALLAAHGLSPIEALGQQFDPHYHEAVMREEGDPAELTRVVAELQRGYKLHDRVLRPSLVKVGKVAPPPPAPDSQEQR